MKAPTARARRLAPPHFRELPVWSGWVGSRRLLLKDLARLYFGDVRFAADLGVVGLHALDDAEVMDPSSPAARTWSTDRRAQHDAEWGQHRASGSLRRFFGHSPRSAYTSVNATSSPAWSPLRAPASPSAPRLRGRVSRCHAAPGDRPSEASLEAEDRPYPFPLAPLDTD